VALSQQGVTPDSTTFFHLPSSKVMMTVAPSFVSCLSLDELLQIAADQALEE